MFFYPLSRSISLSLILWCQAVQAKCTRVRDIHFLSVYEAFMNYKTVTTRDPEWAKGGYDGQNEGRDKRTSSLWLSYGVFVCMSDCTCVCVCVCACVCMHWHCADIALTWRSAPTAVLIWWLGNILEFVYLFIQLQMCVCVCVYVNESVSSIKPYTCAIWPCNSLPCPPEWDGYVWLHHTHTHARTKDTGMPLPEAMCLFNDNWNWFTCPYAENVQRIKVKLYTVNYVSRHNEASVNLHLLWLTMDSPSILRI